MIEPGTGDAATFEAALGCDASDETAETTVRNTGPLNATLGVFIPQDVRIVAVRWATRGKKLGIRFGLAKHGERAVNNKKSPTSRSELPPAAGQLSLDEQFEGNSAVGFDSPKNIRPHSTPIIENGTVDGPELATTPQNSSTDATDATGGTPLLDEVRVVMEDGSEEWVPDLSWLDELFFDGTFVDLDAVEAVFARTDHLRSALSDPDWVPFDDDDDFIGALDASFKKRAEEAKAAQDARDAAAGVLAASGAVAALPDADWATVSRDVVDWTETTVRSLRESGSRGKLLILAPSPGTGKSHGMMKAACDEQGGLAVKRRVGYAVLSRAQLAETEERLRATDPQVRLIVIEGRHAGNCHNFDKVEIATAAGFPPGTVVCPQCSGYPTFRKPGMIYRNKNLLCPYYRTRIEAIEDKEASEGVRLLGLGGPPAIILTTHASAVQGSHLITRRNQGFWDFDTLFMDEDPTSAMVVDYEISEPMLTYSQVDSDGNLDGPSRGSALLREAMKEAMRLREESALRGFRDLAGNDDRIHSREHGSTFAGAALHALLEHVAQANGTNLREACASVVDGMTSPDRGEVLSLTADEVAARFPNRHLALLFHVLEEESVALDEARKIDPSTEPAYRVHLDITPIEDGYKSTIRVHTMRGYANPKTNIVVGDAYANTEHYEGLFNRRVADGDVLVLKQRAVWPTTSTLVRIVTHASSSHLRNTPQFIEHLETKVRPILELERGRKIVFYAHKAMRDDLTVWLLARWLSDGDKALEHATEQEILPLENETIEERRQRLDKVHGMLEAAGFAIEHWGSGRGKDIYRHFDTFIGVSEYMPNVAAVAHEANTIAALAATSNLRVAHWNGYAPRRGSTTFASSLSAANPFYQAAFHRKATDELAQAVHRIRPAIPTDGRQKRAYVLGHQVPWTDELIAATAATAVVDHGKDDIDLETEALGRGARFSITETMSLVSAHEVHLAMAEVFEKLDCWSHIFAHALLSVPSWATIEDLVHSGRSTEMKRSALLKRSLSEGAPNASSIVDRVASPPRSWADVSNRIQRNSRVYLAGHRSFVESLPFRESRRYRPEWAPRRSNGYEFWGDAERFERILNNCYAPDAERAPF